MKNSSLVKLFIKIKIILSNFSVTLVNTFEFEQFEWNEIEGDLVKGRGNIG